MSPCGGLRGLGVDQVRHMVQGAVHRLQKAVGSLCRFAAATWAVDQPCDAGT